MHRRGERGVTAGAALGVVAVLAVGVAATLFFYCPCSRVPGGYLLGTEVLEPVADWSLVDSVPLCQIEVRSRVPHSVNLNCMSSGGRLYLSCANCAGKRWSSTALEHPDARLRAGDQVYPVRLTRVEDDTELDLAWRARAAKVGLDTATPRAEGWWSFRVESRRS
jgi:hypothetical protein